jgi:hypothetical protein
VQRFSASESISVLNDPPRRSLQTWNKLSSKVEILGVFNLVLPYMVLNSEERQERLDEFHKNYDENVLDENLRKEKTRIITTLSQYFDREMILADECLLREDESGAAVYSHIANVIHTAMRELEELEE